MSVLYYFSKPAAQSDEDGNSVTLLRYRDQFAKLSLDTLVFCAHEYTGSIFCTIYIDRSIPNNRVLKKEGNFKYLAHVDPEKLQVQ